MKAPRVRRAALRAADWRFLLPVPEQGRFDHLVLLGASAALRERVLDLGIAERVSEELPATRSADAMVVLHGAAAAPDDVLSSLVAGGAVYWEVNRRSPRRLAWTPDRFRRRLVACGLVPTGMYAVGPSVTRPRVYLPLDARWALSWYMSTLFNPWERWHGWTERALRAFTGLDARRFAPLVADYAIVGVMSAPRQAPSLLDLAMRESGIDDGVHSPLMLTSTHPETLSQRVIVLPFTREGVQPVAVIKVSKTPALNDTMTSEQRTLGDVRSCLNDALRDTLPEPLQARRIGDLMVATESYRPGESLQRGSCRWDRSVDEKIRDLELAADWLAEFHRQTTCRRPPWGAAELTDWLLEPMERYRNAFGVTAPEKRLFDGAVHYASTLAGVALPIVLRKPDFFGSNIVRFGDAISVIDWESSYHGPALCDLLRFVVPWMDVVLRRRGQRSYENFRRLFLEPDDGDRLIRAVHRTIDRYLERLEMERSLLPVLLLYTWLERAVHHAEKQRLQSDVPEDRREGNRHVRRVEILAEHAARLFGPSPAVSTPLGP